MTRAYIATGQRFGCVTRMEGGGGARKRFYAVREFLVRAPGQLPFLQEYPSDQHTPVITKNSN